MTQQYPLGCCGDSWGLRTIFFLCLSFVAFPSTLCLVSLFGFPCCGTVRLSGASLQFNTLITYERVNITICLPDIE